MFGHLNNSLIDDFQPSEFFLSQNYPNPFRDKTVIKYCIAYRTRVKLSVYDADGNEIERLVDEDQNPGTYEVTFQYAVGNLPDGKAGRQLAIGSCHYRFEAGNYKNEKKMELIK